MSHGVVIVGGGHGGFHTANALRDAGYVGPIMIVDAGLGLPYERPPLSKAYLLDSASRGDIAFRPSTFYESAGIRLVMGTRTRAIDRGRTVLLTDAAGADAEIAYDHLVLATGSTPRSIPVPGAELAGVHRLGTVEDADRLSAAFESAAKLVIVGAGFIGLECAAIATDRGLAPVVVNLAERALERAASAPLAAFVCGWHEERGVTFHHGSSLSRILGEAGRVVAVVDSAGRTHPADVVVAGIGAAPNTQLAEDAGLEVDGGVVVDARLRTSDPVVYAIGDCARYPHALLGETVRLESVQNATDHARAVAADIMGAGHDYAAVPWFWSDQGELKIQLAGLTAGADRHVVRGDAASARFSVYCYRGDRLAGADSVGRAGDHVLARKLLAAGVDPTPDQAADPGFPLKSLLPAAPVA